MIIPNTTISKTTISKTIMSRCLLSVAIASSLMLVGCGDDNDFGVFDSTITEPPVVGETTSVFVNSFSAGQIDSQIGAADAATPDAKCDITIEKINYATTGAAGEETTATAALMLPSGDSADCQGDRPILLYAHGTTTDKGYDFTQVGNADNAANSESTLVAANFAAQGYIVVAPNYAGYDDSELGYHPYLVAEQQSTDMVDALDNARSVILKQKRENNTNYANISDSDKLYISGYSQGGYVAMATAKLLQSQNKPITAIATSSGPYALAAFGDEIFNGNVNIGASRFAPLLGAGLQAKYGNIYQNRSDIFLDKYTSADLPNDLTFGELVDAGLFPNNALFENNPSNPALSGLSKGSIFSNLGGYDETDYLIKSDFRAAYVTDAMNNPDGLFAQNGNDLPAVNPSNNLRKALRDNDLRGYIPAMPTFVCGGNQDPTVYFDTNTGTMTKLFQAAAAANPQSNLNITVLDVDKDNAASRPDKTSLTLIGNAGMNEWNINDVMTRVQNNFSAKVQQVKDDASAQGNIPLLAFYTNYHGNLVSPACTQATREFFQQDFNQS